MTRPTPNVTQTAQPGQREGAKETIESVVVAFILAFVFRAFVIEAFVIPTGSMAATLNGEHWSHTCSDCGYSFAVGVNRRPPSGDITNVPSLQCPNCLWNGDQISLRADTESGDRILVFKWPLDFSWLAPGKLSPHRWDVTVFKDPSDGTTNFIKRLVGLPGEVLQILDGDIYAAPLADLPDELVERLRRAREIKRRLTDHTGSSSRPSPASVAAYYRLAHEIARDLAPYLKIQRKTAQTQQAFWAPVLDADHVPRRAQEGTRYPQVPAWVPLRSPSAWQTMDRRLLFDGIDQKRQLVRLDNKFPTDRYGYNSALSPAQTSGDVPVTDLRLCVLLNAQALPADGKQGYFELILTKRGDEFRARLEPDGLVSLLHCQAGSTAPPEVLGTAQTSPLHVERPRRMTLSNVDYRVTLSVDGAAVLSTTNDMYAPDVQALYRLEPGPPHAREPQASAAMAAAYLKAEISHVVLERDVHYRNVTFSEGLGRNFWHNRPGWGTAGNPIMLGPGEYFLLGDNSPQSKDSRLWWEIGRHLRERPDYQLGTVPKDQIIGRAFFVYWPSGYKSWWSLGKRVIPNVGRMRWIE